MCACHLMLISSDADRQITSDPSKYALVRFLLYYVLSNNLPSKVKLDQFGVSPVESYSFADASTF